MTTADSKAVDEAHIRVLINARVEAIRSKNVDGAIANIANDVVSFDVVNPLQNVGLEAARKRTETWFSSLQGPIGFEISQMSIVMGDDVAFCHGLNHVDATLEAGGKLDMWWRATTCYRKIDGQWMIAHEHNSVPFDTEDGKASIDLKP